MLIAETCLLLAIRDRLRMGLSLDEKSCDIELDDQVPTLAREKYFAIVSEGTTPGPRHTSSGGVWDLKFAVKVTFYQGAAEYPRDRRRNIFTQRLEGINAELTKVIRAIYYDYHNVVTVAKEYLTNTQAEYGEFPEPFRTFTPDPRVRTVFKDSYNAAGEQNTGDPTVALARGVTFSGARFMKELV